MHEIQAATGHRPPRLWTSCEDCYSVRCLTQLYNFALQVLGRTKPEQVISGMAQGWDTAIALAAHTLHIPYIAAIPFVGQESKWPAEPRQRYDRLLADAQEVVEVCPGPYAGWGFTERDRWMVDHATCVLALWDGKLTGGTAITVTYAQERQKPVEQLWRAWLAFSWGDRHG